jgi:hypothetical protein
MDPSQLLSLAEELAWKQAADQAIALYERTVEPLSWLNDHLTDLPREHFDSVWTNAKAAYVVVFRPGAAETEKQAWTDALQPWCGAGVSPQLTNEPPADRSVWFKFAFCEGRQDFQREKQAASTTLRAILKGLGHAPSSWSNAIPGGPGPLVGTLTGGLAGAALGYGAGWLGEQALPPSWRKGRLSKTLATLGGVAGAAPGALMTLNNYKHDRPLNSPAIFANDKYAAPYALLCEQTKTAYSDTGFDVGLEPLPEISVDDFKHTVWLDPRVASQLSTPVRAAASGLLESAWYARELRDPQQGRGPRLVGPADIARITAGMGTGYFSGALVGKTLGALMGMPQESQDRLKQTGMWAGIVNSLLPLAFGAR